MNRNYIASEPVINIWSNAKQPFCALSNFAFLEDGIEYENIIYPSTEHAFQAQKYIPKDRVRFSINGDLGNWDGLALLVKANEVEKKKNYWQKKNNIGIIAKMATNMNTGIKLGLRIIDDFQSRDELWINILTKKFSIPYFKDLLKKTENIYILEYDRGANMRQICTFWGGIIVNNNLHGYNLMGKYLMRVRDSIFKNEK